MLQSLAYDLEQASTESFNSGLYISLCTAQQPNGTLTTDGSPDNTFSNVAGLVNIPCMDAPMAAGNIEATEVKELEDIMSKQYRHVSLQGYYPAFLAGQPAGWRVIVDGVTYDLLGAETDSQNTQTRLRLQLVSL